jgi:hypothetical protein
MSAMSTAKTNLIKQLRLMLGDQMTEVELDFEHYDLAITLSTQRYRQRSDGAVQEKDIFIQLQPDQTVYTLPTNVQTIWRIHRRGVGTMVGGSGVNFDPQSAAFMNQYLTPSQQGGGLATWELFGQYKETLSRLFASEINFNWNVDNHELTIINRPRGQEMVMITAYMQKTDDDLITNVYSCNWIRDYALAQAKFMLGQARSKFSGGFAGPLGSVTLNGAELIQQAQAEMERLENEIQFFTTSNRGMPFVIG